LLIGALALELACLIRTNNLSSELTGTIRDSAKQAATASADAVADASKARITADGAKDTAAAASLTAGTAKDSAAAAAAAASRAQRMADAVKAVLVLTGSRADLFKDPLVFTNLLKAAKPLAGQKVDVRFPAGAGISEAQNTAEAIASTLRAAGMRVSGPMASEQFKPTGILVYITWRASPKTKENALKLARALMNVPLVVGSARFEQTAKGVVTLAKAEQIGVMQTVPRQGSFTEGELLPFDDETIVIQVCPHP
jgi:hypothetical protein